MIELIKEPSNWYILFGIIALIWVAKVLRSFVFKIASTVMAIFGIIRFMSFLGMF